MDKKLVKLMNEQIQKEFYSAYIYLSMAAYFEERGLGGFSHWMKKQAREEVSHGMKFFDFLNERGQPVILDAVGKPPAEFSSIKDVFEKTLEHEQEVTASINNIYAAALKNDDPASQVFLHWFIEEQVEEEKAPADILAKLKFIKEDTAGVIMLDKELGARE